MANMFDDVDDRTKLLLEMADQRDWGRLAVALFSAVDDVGSTYTLAEEIHLLREELAWLRDLKRGEMGLLNPGEVT